MTLWSYSTGRWGYRVRVCELYPGGALYYVVTRDGSQVRKSLKSLVGVSVYDKALAKEIARELSAKLREKRTADATLHAPLGELLPTPESVRTLGELFDRWHRGVEREWSKTHRKGQERFRAFWLAAFGSDLDLRRVEAAEAVEVVNAAADAKEWSVRTRQSYLVYLRDAFKYAWKTLKWVTEDYNLSNLKVPELEPDNEHLAYSMDEVKALLPRTVEVDLRCAVVAHLAFISGRRLNAIRSLPASAYEERAVTFRGEIRRVGFVTFPRGTDKAKKRGEAIVVGRAKQLVEELIATPASQASGLLCPSGPLGKGYAARKWVTRKRLNTMLRDAEVLADVEHVHGRAYHGLKRVSVTRGRALASEDAVSRQSGTTSFTLGRVYVQKDVEADLALSEAMENELGAA